MFLMQLIFPKKTKNILGHRFKLVCIQFFSCFFKIIGCPVAQWEEQTSHVHFFRKNIWLTCPLIGSPDTICVVAKKEVTGCCHTALVLASAVVLYINLTKGTCLIIHILK